MLGLKVEFDAPHQRINAIAVNVKGMEEKEDVEKFSESNIEDIPEVTFILDNECIAGVGKRGQDNELV